jgi:hypothetical protein
MAVQVGVLGRELVAPLFELIHARHERLGRGNLLAPPARLFHRPLELPPQRPELVDLGRDGAVPLAQRRQPRLKLSVRMPLPVRVLAAAAVHRPTQQVTARRQIDLDPHPAGQPDQVLAARPLLGVLGRRRHLDAPDANLRVAHQHRERLHVRDRRRHVVAVCLGHRFDREADRIRDVRGHVQHVDRPREVGQPARMLGRAAHLPTEIPVGMQLEPPMRLRDPGVGVVQ